MEEDATLGRIGGFRLIKRLATGGTSDVLLARAEGPHGFERTVVLKRLLSEHQNDPNFARMFAREAAAYARLSHPAIVRLFDFFTASGQLIMVLEYVDGISLARLMTHAAQTGQKLDDRVCFFLAARIFDALSAAHDARNLDTGDPTPVIHRDVNPSNVLIPWDGHAKLADFGIAKITGGEEAETSQGLIKGTYGYMAPEQVRGERVTIRTDVYAASLVLWELLARRKAIQADKLPEMEILRAMAEPNLPKLDVLRPEIHESIREAVNRGLEPNPAKRAITAEEMMGILRAHFDPEDARQRLERVMMPLSPRRSLSDTIAEDLRQTTEGEALPSFASGASPAMTLPLPTERPKQPPPTPKMAPPLPRPAFRTGSTATATAVAQPQQALGSTMVMPSNDAIRAQTPSGFRPVGGSPSEKPTVPAPPLIEPVVSKPTLKGGFASAPPPAPTIPAPLASEPATLQTRKIEDASALLPPSGHMQATTPGVPWPPPPPAFGPPPQAGQVMRSTFPPPVMPGPPARRRSFAVPIVIAAVLGFVVVAVVGVSIVWMRGRTDSPFAALSTSTSTSTSTSASTSTSTATVTGTSIVAPTPCATYVASPSATATTTATATAIPSDVPKPGPNEGVLILPAYAQGHRIFVDGHVKGDGSSPLVVACGAHSVQIGSAGKARDVNVPCGALARIE